MLNVSTLQTILVKGCRLSDNQESQLINKLELQTVFLFFLKKKESLPLRFLLIETMSFTTTEIKKREKEQTKQGN
jgi:hypothetical protein